VGNYPPFALEVYKLEVKMLKTTNFIGLKKEGTIQEVPSEVGKRWCIKGIAEPVAPKMPQVESESDSSVEIKLMYEDKTAKELYDMCIMADITVEARKSKKYYIDALTAE
jgi:hypothetical protein